MPPVIPNLPTRARGRPSLAAAVALLLLFAASIPGAAVGAPIVGDAFHLYVSSQDARLQEFLQDRLPEDEGFHVLGPLDPLWRGDDDTARLFGMVRLLVTDPAGISRLLELLDGMASVGEIERFVDEPASSPPGLRGAVVRVELDRRARSFVVVTPQQLRWMIWRRDAALADPDAAASAAFGEYARAVSMHLNALESGQEVLDMPEPGPLGLPSTVALYPPRPDYVIEGYDNYKRFLLGHEEIRTDFARAITAFVPTDSLLQYWIGHPPQIAYPNKEEPLIQFEFRKFFERGGKLDGIHTLTRDRMSGLQPGEYFFAVGLSGRIRYGYELPREEVDRLEAETGRKLPRANHAYLFPGEPVLTAGAFFVDDDEGPRIVAVNAQSGHYFYSNVTPSVREDIALRSNGYLLTLAHFFAALDREGIPFDDILVSKL